MVEDLRNIPVQSFMAHPTITLTLDETLADAYEKMKANRIRHLPVVDKAGCVIGIFTDVDLNHAYAPRETESGWYYEKDELKLLILRHFMTPDPVTLTPEHTLKDAADIMLRYKFGCVPIVTGKEKKLVGIVSVVDILKQVCSFIEKPAGR